MVSLVLRLRRHQKPRHLLGLLELAVPAQTHERVELLGGSDDEQQAFCRWLDWLQVGAKGTVQWDVEPGGVRSCHVSELPRLGAIADRLEAHVGWWARTLPDVELQIRVEDSILHEHHAT